MSMFDKIKGMMGVPDDDDYDDDDMDFVNENTGYAAQDDYVPEEQDVTPKRNKVVNINSTMQLQVVLVKPERFDDASAIAENKAVTLFVPRTACRLRVIVAGRQRARCAKATDA